MSRTIGTPMLDAGRGTGGAGVLGRPPLAYNGNAVLPAAAPLQGSNTGPGIQRPLPSAPEFAKALVAPGIQAFPKPAGVVHHGSAAPPRVPQASMNSATVGSPPAYKASVMPQASASLNPAAPIASAQQQPAPYALQGCVAPLGQRNAAPSFPMRFAVGGASSSMNPAAPVTTAQHQTMSSALQGFASLAGQQNAAPSLSVQSGISGASAQAPFRRSGVILCVGDSLTAGTTGTKDSYPAQLDQLLQQCKVGNFIMKNVGVFGSTCDAMPSQLQQAIARGLPFAFVLVLGGTNDIMRYNAAPAILAKLKRLHDIAASAPGRPLVGILTIPRSTLFNQGQEETRRAVNAGLAEAVQQAQPQSKFLIDLDCVSVDLAKDGLHYNGKGYEEFAQLAFQAMSQVIG